MVVDHRRLLECRDRQTGVATRQIEKPEGPVDVRHEFPVQDRADRLGREVVVVKQLAVYLPLMAERLHRLFVHDPGTRTSGEEC